MTRISFLYAWMATLLDVHPRNPPQSTLKFHMPSLFQSTNARDIFLNLQINYFT